MLRRSASFLDQLIVSGSNFALTIFLARALTIEDFGFFPPFTFPDPNVTNDQDLMDISTFNVNNCAILEFDFVPNGDSLVFRYVFASTEYSGFTCASYNDAFGFFISGPGIAGPYTNGAMNIAVVPNTDLPVGVNSINSGTPSGVNSPNDCLDVNPNFVADSIYFVSNETQPDTDVFFNGMTVTLTAYAEVICGEEYHIKLAIGDATDDTAVGSEDLPVTTDVLANDNFSGSAVVSAVTQGTNGSVVINGDGTVTYTPNDDFNGSEVYQI